MGKRNPIITAEFLAQVRNALESGIPLQRFCSPFKVHSTAVSRALNRPAARWIGLTPELLKKISKSLKSGLSIEQSCAPLGVHVSTAWRALRRLGLPTKPPVRPVDVISNAMIKHGANPEVRKVRSVRAKQQWADPEKAARTLAGQQKPEAVAAKAVGMKAAWAAMDPAKRATRIQAALDGQARRRQRDKEEGIIATSAPRVSRIAPEVLKQVSDSLAAGISVEKACTGLGVPSSTVRKALKTAGMPTRRPRVNRGKNNSKTGIVC